MTELFKSRPLGHAVVAAFFLIWFVMLGTRALVPTDEGRYAEMPREMAVSGDWVTPRLNGIKYFEKPPLQTWATAAAYKVFGEGEWQARLWTGLCGALGIVLVWLTGRRLFDARTGWAAAMVLASSFWWAALGHINTLDMGLSGMMAVALCSLLLAQDARADAATQRRWMLACWAGMALATMSKGLIGVVLPGAVLVIYTALSRDWAIWKRLHLGKGLLLYFAITAPWFILVSLRNPEFPHYFFIHEHFERFTSKVHRRAGPWYYFIPLLALGILPWLGMLAQGLLQGLKDRSEAGMQRGGARGFQPRLMLLVWAAFIFVFFSISGSKLPSYLLPIYPALALLIALYLQRAGRASFAVAGVMALGLGVAAIVLSHRIPRMTDEAQELPYYLAAIPWMLACGVLLGAAGLWVIVWAWRWSRNATEGGNLRPVFALAAGGFLASQALLMATEPYGQYRAGVPLLPVLAKEVTPETRLYGVGILEHSLPFYMKRTNTMALHPDELEFGLKQQPDRWFPTLEGFIADWTRPGKAIAFVHPGRMDAIRASGLPMRIVAEDTRRIVIANDPAPAPAPAPASQQGTP